MTAAETAATTEPGHSNELLSCCGEFLQLLSSGSTHSLLVPLLKLCSVCFSAMPHNSAHEIDPHSRPLADSGAQILHSAVHIVNAHSTGREPSKQGSVQLLEVMHRALPVAHSPDAHLCPGAAPEGRGDIAQRIDGAVRALCMQPCFLQHAVEELLSAPSQQGLTQFVCKHGAASLPVARMPDAAAKAELQQPQKYLDNVLFAPWGWLEQAAQGGALQLWQRAMVDCLPMHAYWLVGLCSAAPDTTERQDGSDRSKSTRGGAGANQSPAVLWGACMAVLHRSAAAVLCILHCGGKAGSKNSKSTKKQVKQSPEASAALLTALQVCGATIRACADHKVPSFFSLRASNTALYANHVALRVCSLHYVGLLRRACMLMIWIACMNRRQSFQTIFISP